MPSVQDEETGSEQQGNMFKFTQPMEGRAATGTQV